MLEKSRKDLYHFNTLFNMHIVAKFYVNIMSLILRIEYEKKTLPQSFYFSKPHFKPTMKIHSLLMASKVHHKNIRNGSLNRDKEFGMTVEEARRHFMHSGN